MKPLCVIVIVLLSAQTSLFHVEKEKKSYNRARALTLACYDASSHFFFSAALRSIPPCWYPSSSYLGISSHVSSPSLTFIPNTYKIFFVTEKTNVSLCQCNRGFFTAEIREIAFPQDISVCSRMTIDRNPSGSSSVFP